MKTFAEILAQLRAEITDLTTAENTEKIAGIAKSLDTLEDAHKSTQEEAKSAKDNLVKYVKEYALKKPSQVETGIETPVSIEDAFENATKEIIEKRGKKTL